MRNRHWWYRSLYGIQSKDSRRLRWKRNEAFFCYRLNHLGAPLCVKYFFFRLAMDVFWTERWKNHTPTRPINTSGVLDVIDWPTHWCWNNSRLFLRIGRHSTKNMPRKVRRCLTSNEKYKYKIKMRAMRIFRFCNSKVPPPPNPTMYESFGTKISKADLEKFMNPLGFMSEEE